MKKAVMKAVDWAIATGCFVFLAFWGIIAAGASIGLWAIGIREQEIEE